jgi:hypothetical protein
MSLIERRYMKDKIKTDYKVNTITEMFQLEAKKGETCEVCRDYYKYTGVTWEVFKAKNK